MPLTIPDLLKVLFSTFPPQSSENPDTALTAYLMALEGYELRDIETAIRRFIRGEVDWHNMAFAPTAPLLGGEVRRCLEARLDRERDRRPPLPPPDVHRSPESMARVRALMEQTVAKLGGSMRTPDAAAERARRQEQVAKADQHFADDYVNLPGGQRLSRELAKKVGYSVGDPEGDRDVA